MWHLMMCGILAEMAVIVVLIVVIVHYAREGAMNAGKLEVHESMLEEAKAMPIRGREVR
jgi:hypothetical protein